MAEIVLESKNLQATVNVTQYGEITGESGHYYGRSNNLPTFKYGDISDLTVGTIFYLSVSNTSGRAADYIEIYGSSSASVPSIEIRNTQTKDGTGVLNNGQFICAVYNVDVDGIIHAGAVYIGA
jgi:hypothetical protein